MHYFLYILDSTSDHMQILIFTFETPCNSFYLLILYPLNFKDCMMIQVKDLPALKQRSTRNF